MLLECENLKRSQILIFSHFLNHKTTLHPSVIFKWSILFIIAKNQNTFYLNQIHSFTQCLHPQFSSSSSFSSSILDPRSSILILILDTRYSILDTRSSILDPRSSILDPRSSILDPGSSILNPRFSSHSEIKSPYFSMLFQPINRY